MTAPAVRITVEMTGDWVTAETVADLAVAMQHKAAALAGLDPGELSIRLDVPLTQADAARFTGDGGDLP